MKRMWSEYKETILDPNANIMINTARPENFFLSLTERSRVLAWWANIVIAIGLLITFLGIIAALSTLDFSGGVDAMQSKLNELMIVAGAKFWASVGGILASIILRSFDYRFQENIETQLNKLCDYLEYGMVYLPPQRIANQQLEQLKEQTPALKTFSEQMAVAMEGAMEKQMAPMVQHLGSIQKGIEKISGDNNNAIIETFTNRSEREMAGLSEAIIGMTQSMAAMSERMEQQSGEADRQIEEAVKRFSKASEEMRQSFGELNRNFEAVAQRMRADSEEAGQIAHERISNLMTNMENMMGSMQQNISQAAGQITHSTVEAAQNSARIGQVALEDSFSKFASRFEEVGGPLVDSMGKAGDAISQSSDNLLSSQQSIGDHARAITNIAEQSSEISTAFGHIANDMRAASDPVRQSADAISNATNNIENIIRGQAALSEEANQKVSQLAEALADTSRSAETAWREYRARFEEVDKSLAQAVSNLTNASQEHAQSLNDRVGDVDKALAEGVAKLASALQPLTNLGDSVNDITQQIERFSKKVNG